MIVMKFGGSSVATPASIKRVASIVQSQVHRHPIVVVSAFGDTTDNLAAILRHSARAESYLVWKAIKELREYHFSVAEELLGSQELGAVDHYLRETFRDLHVRMLEVSEGERVITPEETAAALSLGEQLSSTIVCAAFRQLGIASCHMDSRKLILTDNEFTSATPRYWETYARVRWTVPLAARKGVVVMGGFIGSNDQGQTTTLGRGGSDLTATLVGAAVNAEEIQIWKDVDGVLTADPRLKRDAWLVKKLSYSEASALAKAGAQILHPETIAPAKRLRIPIAMRNTFNPSAEGTRIDFGDGAGTVAFKSIVCKTGITLLEVSPAGTGVSIEDCSSALNSLFARRGRKMEPLAITKSVLYLALDDAAKYPETISACGTCLRAHLRSDQALITLVGDGIASSTATRAHLGSLLSGVEALVLPPKARSSSLHVAIPQCHLSASLNVIHKAFFARPDAQIFTKQFAVPVPRRASLHVTPRKDRAWRVRQALVLAGAGWISAPK